MGDSSYWTGEPAVRAWEDGLVVLYPNPQMSGHRSAVSKLGEKETSNALQFKALDSSCLRASQIQSQGEQVQVMDGKQPP